MSKTRLIPFDLEKAKTGAKLVTRDGYPARLIFDSAEGKPLVALIKNQYEEYEFACLFYNDGRYDTESFSGFDLFIEENVEEPDDYNPYKETVESIADMVERYANNGDLQDFYDNVKAKCKDAFEYDKKWCKNQDEQKPIDKVEPKFKVGDWIVQQNVGVYKVTEVCESWYEVIDSDESNYSISFDKEYMCHLWSIKDAKDGDVLCYETKNELRIFICNNDYHYCSYYNGHLTTNDFVIQNRLLDYIHPATKEQRDLLFPKMKDAGYEWNSDTKELKKKSKLAE